MEQKTVLVVDDSSLVRLMMQKIFSQSFPDWRVLEAKTGEEALEATQATHPQLALIDYNMPGINGIDLAVQLMEKFPALSIHLVTANVQQKMQERAEALGIGFIKKPITQEKISSILS